jgi:hypothetical protein
MKGQLVASEEKFSSIFVMPACLEIREFGEYLLGVCKL